MLNLFFELDSLFQDKSGAVSESYLGVSFLSEAHKVTPQVDLDEIDSYLKLLVLVLPLLLSGLLLRMVGNELTS